MNACLRLLGSIEAKLSLGGRWPVVFAAALFSGVSIPMARADEVLFSVGSGPQRFSDQRNRVGSVDYSFYTWKRSMRQHLQVGVAYTRLTTNASSNSDMYAISVYPQLTFYPPATSKIALAAPSRTTPFFFVRALGPSYISANALGDRQQEKHFAFQAQIGAGVLIEYREGREIHLSVSWKHFSNANLFSDNDGIDVPFVFTFGVRF
jgi:hypothetical protein